MDIVLHRKPAFRHIYFNRHNIWITNSSISFVCIIILCLDILLKSIVLYKSLYFKHTIGYHIIHVILSSICEQISSILGFILIFVLLPYTRIYLLSLLKTKPLERKLLERKMVLYLVLPRLFQGIMIIMQIFDNSAFLLFLLSILIISIQYISFHILAYDNKYINIYIILFAFIISVLFKFMIRSLFFRAEDILLLGIIA